MMPYKDEVNLKYFEWMMDILCRGRYANNISFRKLLLKLHHTEFRYSIPRDENRADDGIRLRYRFACSSDDKDSARYLTGPCSVLEMMLALAIRCEIIMEDPLVGNRTGQWFWGMIRSLGLGTMIDSRFDEEYVEAAIDRFLDHEYEPNGKGGLFTIKDCKDDLRTAEIFYQLCWYLDSIYV